MISTSAPLPRVPYQLRIPRWNGRLERQVGVHPWAPHPSDPRLTADHDVPRYDEDVRSEVENEPKCRVDTGHLTRRGSSPSSDQSLDSDESQLVAPGEGNVSKAGMG